MPCFGPLMKCANIELADLTPEIPLNGLLVYVGDFPNGGGRILLNPSLGPYDSPPAAAVIAHELSHILLHQCSDHPASVLDLLLDPNRHRSYRRVEAEADRLAAHLLVPRDILAAYPSRRFPTLESLAQTLDVPVRVVRRALLTKDYDTSPVQALLSRLTGQQDFIPRPQALAA